MSKRKKQKTPGPARNAPASALPSPGAQHRTLELRLALVAVVCFAFFPVLHASFIGYDDPNYVTANDHVKTGLTISNILWAFTSTDSANWHPLTWLSHILDAQFFGLQPWGHHLTSLLLHICNTLLVFLVFRTMTGANGRSFFLAAFFGLHPLHVESVAWISERKDVLSTAFLLLTLWAYTRYVREPVSPNSRRKFFYVTALLLFALGLMSKPMLVTLPCVLLLLDFWPLHRWQSLPKSKLFLEKIPFFILAAISSIVTFLAQKSGGAVATVELVPFADRLQNAAVAYARYLGKAFWPSKLSIFYPLPATHLPPLHWPMILVLASALLILILSVLAFIMRRRFPWFLTGWFWFVGTLVPVIGLLQVGLQALADRYTYVPFIGDFFLVIVWGAAELASRLRIPLIVSRGTALAALFACLILTRVQAGYWTSNTTLFTHALAVTGDNFMPHYILGNVQLFELNDPAQAIPEYEAAVRLWPKHMDTRNNLGTALLKAGRVDDAIAEFQSAAREEPRASRPHNSLGVAFEQKGALDDATREFAEAVRLDPADYGALCNLGFALQRQGRAADAVHQFELAVKLQPRDPDAHNFLGVAYARADRLKDAIAQFHEALRLKPGFPDAIQNLQRATIQPPATSTNR